MSGHPCKPTGKNVKTTGTIRVQIRSSGGASAQTAKVFLTPNSEFSASHGGKHYGLFFPVNGSKHEIKSTPYEPGEGVPICVEGEIGSLVAAGAQQTSVEIEVVEKDTACTNSGCERLAWKLQSITTPAPGKKK